MDYIDFWQQVEPLLNPVQPAKIFYRVYYDDNGQVLFYSMQDLPGNYLDIDIEDYRLADGNAVVQHGKLIYPRRIIGHKLVPNSEGIPCHRDSVMVVTNAPQNQKWKLKYYESDH
jgi:hypothetical protein